MRLSNLSEFRELFYSPGSRPKLSTLRKRIDLNKIPGGIKQAGRYYVDLDAFNAANDVLNNLQAQQSQLVVKSPWLRDLL